MSFIVGDLVKFLNEVGGGVVTRIENKTVYVQNEDGFEVPSTIAQLLKVGGTHAEATPFIMSKPVENNNNNDYIDLTDNSEEDNYDNNVNILLILIPQHKKNGKIFYDFFLVNDCSYNIMYVAGIISENGFCGLQAGMLENDSSIHLTEISDNNLKTNCSIRLDIIFFKKGNYLPVEPLTHILKFDEFYMTDPANYVANQYFDKKALLYNITKKYLLTEIENLTGDKQKQLEKQKKKIDVQPSKQNKKPIESDIEEVDLHIEQLLDDFKSLTAVEMLDIQMRHFNNTLEKAIRSRKKRIIFIHGVGNGRLRLEIQRALEKNHKKLRYQDASFKEYGYGATMVIL